MRRPKRAHRISVYKMKNGLKKAKLSNMGGVEKKRFNNKNKKKKSTVAKLPKGKDDASSNWKSLLEELKSERRSKGEAKPKWSEHRLSKKNIAKQQEPPNDNDTKKKPDIWFDDVDEMLLDPEDRESMVQVESVATEAECSAKKSNRGLVKEKSFSG